MDNIKEIDGIPIFGSMPSSKKSAEKTKQDTAKRSTTKDKTSFKCMDCNFKFRDFDYKERPRCPYCANNNTVKSESFFEELI